MNEREFWDKKILTWERNSYAEKRLWGGPLRARRDLFLKLSEKHLEGKTVFEAGCGSGRLVEELFARGIKRYVGFDLSPVAIVEAKERALRAGLAGRAEFVAADVSALAQKNKSDFGSADFSFSLGLLDWLTDESALTFFRNLKTPSYLHSFSERRFSMARVLHRAYVISAYGRKNLTYTPKYRRVDEIEDLLEESGNREPSIYRNSKMSFSAFAFSFVK
ncbi:MAG: class I SAM-dependent methyltransferase [Bdellovibrionia bacterium]